MKRLTSTSVWSTLLLVFFNLISDHSIAQNGIIKGAVYEDDSKQPIPFANLFLQQTTTGTVTDFDGKFQLPASPGTYTLIVSFAGYKSDTSQVVVASGETIVRDFYLQGKALKIQSVVIKSEANRVSELSNVVLMKRKTRRGVAQRYYSLSAQGWDENSETYEHKEENGFLPAKSDPLSTFSIDVDAASYANVRRMINQGTTPPKDAVRVEEMINYFTYDYAQPKEGKPFSINTEISDCPWEPKHRLIHIGMQGEKIETEDLPPQNLTFLLDVSGSMDTPSKLGLVKRSMKLLVNQMDKEDQIAIVVYAGAAGLVLPSTSGDKKEKIINAIEELEAAGSTAGGQGIVLAYKTAEKNLKENGNNRVILCTDGDFNVGVSSDKELVKLIEEKRESGVFLTVLGYGTGNLKDSKMEKLADKGNGNYAYIDNILEAKKVLVSEMGGTLQTIAKDVKFQVEFNPAKVASYRLIGYENRLLEDEDFNDDTKDAGELGAGHTVTALYEIIPVGVDSKFSKGVDPLKYQKKELKKSSEVQNELLTVKIRYKNPKESKSHLIEHPLIDQHVALESTSENFRFSAAVAAFGMIMTDSKYKSEASMEQVVELAKGAKGIDDLGYRSEFIRLAEAFQLLAED